MKILQIIPNLDSGGAEHFVCDLSYEFVSQGYSCDLLCLYDIESDNSLLKVLDGKVRVFSLHKRIGFQFSLFFKLAKFIKAGGYDVVNAHLRAINYLPIAAIVAGNIRFFATIHSDANFEAGEKIGVWVRRFLFKTKLCVPITISEESKSSFYSLYKVDSHLIYNGVSPYVPAKSGLSLRDAEDQIVFIHVASCQPVKNQAMLFNAFNRLRKNYPDVVLYWAGAHDKQREYYESILPLMGPGIRYLGVVDNVRDYMSNADAMCLSSVIEGMPITIIEAFSTGCIPICTPAGGCKNMIVDGNNGILSGEVSEESYYSALERFVELSLGDKQRMREQSRSSFSRYAISECVHNYYNVYSVRK